MKKQSISRAAIACALLSYSSITYAFEAENYEGIDEGNTIIVTGNTPLNEAEMRANKVAGGTDIVGHDDYADKSLTSLRDALSFSPGIYLQPRYGQEVRISIRGSGLSRGFHMRGLTLLQDGVPINLADDNGDFQELEPIFFDHLEVYRGANALRFGSGTLGGAINGVTPTGQSAEGLYLRGDIGSFNSYRGLASFGTSNENGDIWAAISKDSADGDRDHAKRDSLRFHGNVGLNISSNIKSRFYVSFNNINQQLPGALNYNDALTSPKKGNFTGNQARDIDSIRLQNRTSIDFGSTKLDVGLFLNSKSLFHPIYQVIDQESFDRGAFFRLDHENGPFEITLGGEARFGEVNSKRFINIDGERSTPTFQADQKAKTANIYGEIRYSPSEKLNFITGGIFATGTRQQQENYNSFAGGERNVFAKADFNEFSPKFGILYQINPNISFYANYSKSAEFPGFIELAQISQFVPIKAQTAWTKEIGSRGSMGAFTWDITAYQADIKGEILQFTIGTDIPASTFNAGKTRHMGIEAALTIEPTNWLRLRQIYQYNDFKFKNDAQYGDNRLPVIPRHVYRAEIRLGNEKAHIAPNIEWVPVGAFADYNNAVKVPSYAILGMTAGFNILPNIDLFFDARNLNKKKAIGDISAVITATAASIIYQPTEQRAIFGGFRARF
ncbi:ligand-gated channel protein [Sphingorhabdus lutea]|uniref:Ligand-gated channel protein n=1 Tax=Sphingorhabdus lutea TaxID=1913578 RepID=A0A1L3JBQ6_9SPHN|nr:TonB-dependent receptor [Sphingorhabdus lutea]APG62566.1 ligand-gated channel protein [Sphingorhabdus lutea]